jgi:hypothetical protein
MFIEPFSSSGRQLLLIKNLLPSNERHSVVCFVGMLFQSRLIATAVSLAPQFLLPANMPQYKGFLQLDSELLLPVIYHYFKSPPVSYLSLLSLY